MTRRFNLLVSENGGCGAVDHHPPKIIKSFEISGGSEISQEEIEIQIISYIKANPDEFMNLWEILSQLHDAIQINNLESLPEFFQEYLEDNLDVDSGEALLTLMGQLEEVELPDLQKLIINSTFTQETDFCLLYTTINLIEVPEADHLLLE